jgi:hypothetical protein
MSMASTRVSERGVAIVAVAFFALVAMAYISATLTSSVAVQNQARYYTAAQRANDIAESAVHQLMARLSTPAGAEIFENGGVEGSVEGEDGTRVRYRISIWSGADDGADNDQDGQADESDEIDVVEVRSTGYFDRVARTVRVTLLARYRDAEVGSATYIADPFTAMNFSGNEFTIQGQNHDIDGKALDGEVPAIGVPHSENVLLEKIGKNAADKITGKGGSPSVMNVPELDVKALVDEGARSAALVLKEPVVVPSKDTPWGTVIAPTIVHSPHGVKISGGARGVGIMLIDGDLEISGSFEWRGLIIVRGNTRFVGGGGGKRIIGAMIIANDTEEIFGGVGLDMRGTVDILFSQDAVNRVMAAFRTYTILNWRDGPNPVDA